VCGGKGGKKRVRIADEIEGIIKKMKESLTK
jgi:hypothetical protein